MKEKSKKEIFPLLLSIFVDSIGWGIIFPVLDTLIINNKTGIFLSNTSIITRNLWYELLIGIYCFCMFISSPLLGSLSDRYGRKKLLILSLLGAGTGFFVCSIGIYFSSLCLLFIGRVISGITAGNFAVAQAAITDKSTPAELPSRIGYILLANGVGFACGPILGGVLLDKELWTHISYYAPFIITAFSMITAAFLVAIYFKETFRGNTKQKIHLFIGFNNMREAFTLKSVRSYFIALLLFMAGYTIFFSNMPIFFQERFATGGTGTGYILSFFATLFTLGVLWILPQLTKRFSLEKIILISLLIQILSYLIFALLNHEWSVWIILAPIALTVAFTYIAKVSLISEHTPSEIQGKMMGVVGSVIAFSWGMGPIFAGVLMEEGTLFVYITSIILFLISFIIVFLQAKNNQYRKHAE